VTATSRSRETIFPKSFGRWLDPVGSASSPCRLSRPKTPGGSGRGMDAIGMSIEMTAEVVTGDIYSKAMKFGLGPTSSRARTSVGKIGGYRVTAEYFPMISLSEISM